MSRSLRHLSRWVLSLEMLLCFLPVTCWFEAVMSSSIRVMGSLPTILLLFASASLVGPFGLIVAAKTVLFRRPAGRLASAALCVLGLWTFAAYLVLSLGNPGELSSGWRDIVLVAVLPGLAAAHLAYMASAAPRSSVTA